MSDRERDRDSGGGRREDRGATAASSGKVVYVGRLSSRTREGDIEDAFSKYGRIQRLDLKAGYAFLEYEDARDSEDAIRSLDGTEIDGSRIVVEPSHRGEGRCFACGKEGHWARDCRDARERGGGRSRGCFVCGELGHFARDCKSSGRSRYSERHHPYSRSRRRSRSRSRSRSPRRRYSRSRSRSRSPRRRRSRSRSRSERRSRSRSPSKSRSRSRSRSASVAKASRSRSRSVRKDDRSPSPRKSASRERSVSRPRSREGSAQVGEPQAQPPEGSPKDD